MDDSMDLGTDRPQGSLPDQAREDVAELGEKAQLIRILIGRIPGLDHYRIFEDIEFLLEAIGKKDYEGSPALDVLPSSDDIERERRERVKEYIYCLKCWAEEKELDDAISEFKVSENLLRNVYLHLGDADLEKKHLALSLMNDLEEKAISPEDVLSEISDEDFIKHVYATILNREPDSDDMTLRLLELKHGRTRQELIKSVLESKESSRKAITEIAVSIRQRREV